MKVIALQNILHKGNRIVAGEKFDLADDVAKKFVADKLVKAEKQPAANGKAAGDDKQPAANGTAAGDGKGK